MAQKVKIQLLYDQNDCETCGGGVEYGGRVWIDGKLVWEYLPHADCYGNQYYTEADLMKIAFDKLGIDFEEVEEGYFDE